MLEEETVAEFVEKFDECHQATKKGALVDFVKASVIVLIKTIKLKNQKASDADVEAFLRKMLPKVEPDFEKIHDTRVERVAWDPRATTAASAIIPYLCHCSKRAKNWVW